MKLHCYLLLIIALTALLLGSLSAADRVALVIGINDYPAEGDLPDLKNCVNDAKLIEKTLQSVGFTVTLVEDASYSAMDEALTKFESQIEKGGTALVYFAGHGIEFGGQNYLMAVNARLKARSRLGEESLKAETFASAMVLAGARSSFLLLDCCREMPPAAGWATRGRKKSGLAEITIEGDIVIGMAAGPGKPALEPDEAGGNSPYALALSKWIPTGLTHTDIFQKVRVEVDEMTGGQQRTWENGSFLHPFHFAESGEMKPKKEKQYPGGRAFVRKAGEKKANAWGIHDMLGNLWEWTGDWYGDYPSSFVTNPIGPDRGTFRVNRGGGWSSDARRCRAAIRYGNSPGSRINNLGFRVAVSSIE